MHSECDWVGCGAVRREVNHWFVVYKTSSGVHIYEWDKASDTAREKGKKFCGHAHMMNYVSRIMTPDNTKPDRESTLELKPPLTRDGSTPEENLNDETLD